MTIKSLAVAYYNKVHTCVFKNSPYGLIFMKYRLLNSAATCLSGKYVHTAVVHAQTSTVFSGIDIAESFKCHVSTLQAPQMKFH